MSMNFKKLASLAVFVLLAHMAAAPAQVVRTGEAYNPYTGQAAATGYNPYTGTRGVGQTAYNPYTGTREQSKDYYNPYTGNSAQVQRAYNPYTGKSAYHYSYQRR
jgi:hypothetical protein